MRVAKELGHNIILITDKTLENDPWPWDSISEVFYLEKDQAGNWHYDYLEKGMAWLMRTRHVDRIIALDDFDVEKGAALREEFRFPGMGQTTARHFRDKLAMRIEAANAGINVPPFSALFNDEQIRDYIGRVPAPWVVKPRGEASATGIKKIHTEAEFWEHIEKLGERRYHYLVEQFKPGDVFHADALSVDGKVVFCRVSQYLSPPFEVAHGGGIFRSAICEFGGKDDKALQKMTADVMKAFRMKFSASHTEFIRAHEDGKYYFLETSSRVGGAHLSEMVEISSGVNLWREWALIEIAMARGEKYEVPQSRNDYAGIIISLARQEWPDNSVFNDPEIAWRLDKKNHVGLIVRSGSRQRVLDLLDNYVGIVARDFHAAAPPKEKSSH
jgi:hypothetical protein